MILPYRQLNMRMDNGYGYGVSLKYRRSTVFSTFFRRFFSIWVYDLLKSVTGYSIRAGLGVQVANPNSDI